MPSFFLLNAIVLFVGVIVFLVAGFAGAISRRLHPRRYRLLLTPLGFVVSGGICISAQQHLLRWIHHGHLQHSYSSGLVQTIVLLIGGVCGLLAGLGLGTSLDASFAAPASGQQPGAVGPQRTRTRSGKAKIVPISLGRTPGIVPRIKASSDRE